MMTFTPLDQTDDHACVLCSLPGAEDPEREGKASGVWTSERTKSRFFGCCLGVGQEVGREWGGTVWVVRSVGAEGMPMRWICWWSPYGFILGVCLYHGTAIGFMVILKFVCFSGRGVSAGDKVPLAKAKSTHHSPQSTPGPARTHITHKHREGWGAKITSRKHFVSLKRRPQKAEG